MELELNKESGLLRIGKYTLHPRMTREELEDIYPELETKEYRDSLIHIVYKTPPIDFGGHRLIGEITFYDQFASMISLVRINHETDLEDYLRQKVDWTRKTQMWFKSFLGEPDSVEPGVYMEEPDVLSVEELKDLKYWWYKFKWGEFGFAYHWEFTAIIMNPDYHYQIRNWDEMRENCKYLAIHAEQHNHPSSQNLPHILKLIDILSVHFDYLSVRPHLYLKGVSFELKLSPESVRVLIDVRPDKPQKIYAISGSHTTKKAYATELTLVDQLRLFFDSEHDYQV